MASSLISTMRRMPARLTLSSRVAGPVVVGMLAGPEEQDGHLLVAERCVPSLVESRRLRLQREIVTSSPGCRRSLNGFALPWPRERPAPAVHLPQRPIGLNIAAVRLQAERRLVAIVRSASRFTPRRRRAMKTSRRPCGGSSFALTRASSSAPRSEPLSSAPGCSAGLATLARLIGPEEGPPWP